MHNKLYMAGGGFSGLTSQTLPPLPRDCITSLNPIMDSFRIVV